jgi:hypothetical protein
MENVIQFVPRPNADRRPAAHWSSCAVNNGPALPVGPCDCGGYQSDTAPAEYIAPKDIA